MRVLAYSSSDQLFFDAIVSENHTSSMTKTEHPIEIGSKITDHSYANPDELTLILMSSDVNGRNGHSIETYKSLKQLQKSGEPLNVVTSIGTYKNMLITSISLPRDSTSINSATATIMLEEMIIVSTSTVSVTGRGQGQSNNTQKSNNTSSGTKQAVSVENKSVLKDMVSSLFGGKK